jgi:hypothetical protein
MSLFRHVFIYGEDMSTDTHLIGPVISRAIGPTAQIVEFVTVPSDIMFLLENSNPFDGDLRMGLQSCGPKCSRRQDNSATISGLLPNHAISTYNFRRPLTKNHLKL